MKYRFRLPKKIVFGAAATFLLSFASAQTVSEGIVNLDSHKYAKAKEIFYQMIAKSPTAENYYYLGYSYLSLLGFLALLAFLVVCPLFPLY